MLELEITDTPVEEERAVLISGLARNSEDRGGEPRINHALGIFVRDKDGRVTAGLAGSTFWHLLCVDLLWVDEALRGQGMGKKLVQAAEKEAVGRGCHSSYLWTQSWSAPGFYEKLGYQKFVVMEDVPPKHQRIGFMKRLAA